MLQPRELIDRVGKVIDGVHGVGDMPRQEVRSVPNLSSQGVYTGGENRIRLGQSETPDMALTHEIAHALDYRGLPGSRFQSRTPSTEGMRNLLGRIYEAPTTRRLQEAPQGKTRDYLLRPEELFGAAYTQYIAWKSGGKALIDQIERSRERGNLDSLRYWEHDEFIPIARAMDELFKEQGWLNESSVDTP